MSGYTYYNDIEHFPCEVLRKNIKLGLLPEGYVDERDIREVRATDLVGYQHIHLFAGIGAFPLGFQRAGVPEHLRIISGGFPCQDISNAGKRAGLEGEHSGLWFEMFRLVQETIDSGMGPDYICIENVAAITGRGLSRVLADLAQAGFDAEWQCLRASDFGAPHQRERIFIVAYPNQIRESKQKSTLSNGQRSAIESAGICQWEDTASMAHASSQGPSPQWNRWNARTYNTDCSRSNNVADASSTGQQECHVTPVTEGTGHSAWRKIAPGTRLVESSTSRREWQHQVTGREEGAQPLTFQSDPRQSQPVLGGNFDRSANWLDGYRWPAGPGEQQHTWEPSRTITGKQKNRVARLKALGNAIVVPCTEYIGRRIVAHENMKNKCGGAA